MTSHTEWKSLRFVTWNTNGIKDTRRSPQKFRDWLSTLDSLHADVVFLQETHVGPQDTQYLKNDDKWKVYFTVYSSRSRGVAILIRDTVEFKYICHDEDCSGGYIVLFCHLFGELYTLVNVYNHKADFNVLGRLKEYLTETAEGVLVVGGDFNTGILALHSILQDFTYSLKLEDIWPHIYPQDEGFTWCQKRSSSRIDKFFLREESIRLVTKIKVEYNSYTVQNISDHYPLVLQLSFQKQPDRKYPKVAIINEDRMECNTDRKPGKISGAEILSAIKSLSDKAEHRPATEDVGYYKSNFPVLSETLKREYNNILMNQHVPENFKYLDDRHDMKYLIFSEILAKRLNAFFSLENKCEICVIVSFERSPQNINWSFLQTSLKRLNTYYEYKTSTDTPFVPPPDNLILQNLLSHTPGLSIDLKHLEPDCPLNNAILNLALNELDRIVRCESECKTTVSYHKKALFIDADESKKEQIIILVENFENDSGVRLNLKLL